jgi:1-acyl-sn-glycerol-3-phosphate acyltransferase
MRIEHAARGLLEYLLFWFGLIGFGFCCLVWSLIASVLYRLLPRRSGARLGQRAIMAGFRGYLTSMEALGIFRCDLSVLDTLSNHGPMVIAPNHPSLVDAVVVISRLPRVVCITKARLWDNLFLGGAMRLAGYIRNDTPLDLVKQATKALEGEQQLLIFPEGTRTVLPPINAFKGGFLLMARRSGVPVQTVFLEYDSRFLGKGWPLYRKPPLPVIVTAKLGKRFTVTADLRGSLGELERYFRRELPVVSVSVARGLA